MGVDPGGWGDISPQYFLGGPYNHPPMLLPVNLIFDHFSVKIAIFRVLHTNLFQFALYFTILGSKWQNCSRAFVPYKLSCEQKLQLQEFFSNTIPLNVKKKSTPLHVDFHFFIESIIFHNDKYYC
jgi:hypothetical protein